MASRPQLPELPYQDWKETKTTLHLILQILGKVRLGLTPRKNHWWYITEYVSPKGFSTSPIYYNDGIDTFEILLNLSKHQIEIHDSRTEEDIFIPLSDQIVIADLYQQILSGVKALGCKPKFVEKPFDMGIDTPFLEQVESRPFNITYVKRFWTIMRWVDSVMKEFSGRFYGKTCPVHLYWHHMDLAVTRFSGRKGPDLEPNARLSDRDAYSHEVISFGFWAGDEDLQEPAFYSYTYPSPEGIDKEPLSPKEAIWTESNGSHTAIYTYANLLKEADPRKVLLDFFETSYRAGSKLADWDVEGLEVKGLSDL